MAVFYYSIIEILNFIYIFVGQIINNFKLTSFQL